MGHDVAIVRSFLCQCRELLCEITQSGQTRFLNYGRLREAFERSAERFQCEVEAGTEEQRTAVAERQLTPLANEIGVAAQLLSCETCITVEYEPTPSQGNERIDFRVELCNDKTVLVDTKTIQPALIDGGAACKSVKCLRGRIELVYEGEGASQMLHDHDAARRTMGKYAHELEEKRTNYPLANYAGLVLCGDDSQWHWSHLEDFSDFYFGGRHRDDDGHKTPIETTKSPKRNIDFFCYVGRPVSRVQPRCIRVFSRFGVFGDLPTILRHIAGQQQ